MTNFKQDENLYIADEGYVFKLKNSDMTCKTVRLGKYSTIDNYEIVPEDWCERSEDNEYTENY